MPKFRSTLLLAAYATLPGSAHAQTPEYQSVPGASPANSAPGAPIAPDWAYPDSPSHHQVGPPADFHRPPRLIPGKIGVFDGQADVGAALAPAQALYKAGKYTITSAGYNVWYTRDEFRYLWKKMSGDVSLAANIDYPNANGFGDRKAVLIIRQDLNDDSKEALVALHGGGMIHIAQRPQKGARISDMEYRIGSRGGLPGGASPDSLVTLHARRIGIQKKGDEFSLWVSEQGEPMHQFGAPITLHLNGPFYVGVGFVSHLPTTTDTAVLSDLVLKNAAGKVR
ncbi:MAG: hypothetical protein WA840_13200 [Caulobacteraceae bacterium]